MFRLAVIGIAASAPSLVAASVKAEPKGPTCVTVVAEARYRNAGYDHMVDLLNGCDEPLRCVITTNVNPSPIEVTVGEHTMTEVLTFRGSPARQFYPHLSCRFVRDGE